MSAAVERTKSGRHHRLVIPPVRPDWIRPVGAVAQAAVVALAVVLPYYAVNSIGVTDLIPVFVLAGSWVIAVRAALAAAHFQAGPALPAATGTIVGLVVAQTFSALLSGVEVGTLLLLTISVDVFVCVLGAEMLLRRTPAGKHRVLVVGSARRADYLLEEMRRTGAAGFELVGRVTDRRGAVSADDLPRLGGLVDLERVIEDHAPDILVLADPRTYDVALDRVFEVEGCRCSIVDLTAFFERAFRRVPLEDIGAAWFMSVFQPWRRAYARGSKRAFDLVVASLALVVVLPLLPLIALVVWRTSGPILYRQVRIGARGRQFTMYKFRSMVSDAETSGGPRWCADDDERVTRWGRVLRETHLDELPQLMNVLKGEMSIVGPRPERPEFVSLLEEHVPFWNRRLLVKPGVTGWAQVNAGYASDYESMARKLSYDLWYLRNRSLALDLVICLRTAVALLSSFVPSRSTEGGEVPVPDEI